jgi:predicted nucleic acid-binding protein
MRRASPAMNCMNAVDTNILLYARDPRDPRKQSIAISLIDSLNDPVLLWQVACEYAAASRKLEPFGCDRAAVMQDISDLRKLWKTALPSWAVIDRAADLLRSRSISFWDAAIIAGCVEAGVTHCYSEDLSSFGKVEGVEFTNPF